MEQISNIVHIQQRLDRDKWHRPLMSVIITHHNYADHVEDAILSVIDQTHSNLECVIVDDGSDTYNLAELKRIVRAIDDDRVRIVELPDNVGQIDSFFVGMQETTGQFVCPLDPDDRYAKDFLEQSLAAHLNKYVFVPLVCSDQYTLQNEEVVASVMTRHGMDKSGETLKFIPAHDGRWHWSSTSSLCLRRDALKYLLPHRPVVTRFGPEMGALDSYLAPAAHKMGGTIFIREPLVYRSAHDNNAWLRTGRVSLFETCKRDDAQPRSYEIRKFADEVLAYNSAPVRIGPARKRRLLAKWKRSIRKRLPWRS